MSSSTASNLTATSVWETTYNMNVRIPSTATSEWETTNLDHDYIQVTLRQFLAGMLKGLLNGKTEERYTLTFVTPLLKPDDIQWLSNLLETTREAFNPEDDYTASWCFGTNIKDKETQFHFTVCVA